MPKNWHEITDDELLNFDGAHTGQMAQYERIMAKKTVDALMEVRAGLHDVKVSMHTATDKLDSRLQEVQTASTTAAKSQSRLQWVGIGLTVVIVAATLTYTFITWESVKAQREANQIQREALAAAKPSAPSQ